MISRLLVANRGEIAVRIVRTCRQLGIETVAIYSEADPSALHVRAADHAEPVGAAAPADGYLSIGHVIDAARRSGADAVHPGYGFLSENPVFAQACADAGLTFVGPSPSVLATVGSKIDARRLAAAAGVPVVPGEAPARQSVEGVTAAVQALGYPVLIKPSAGGGGKGMHVVESDDAIGPAIAAARREAVAAFGDDTLYVERHLLAPRHIEVQLVGDRQDHLVHLYERECSIQRRYQKVVEESPAPALSPGVRERITGAAVAAARAAGYDNVGTVEFLVEGASDDARFYFLEMNTRLQVEHPITELRTGLDLVAAQIAIAGGEAVPWPQDGITVRGHAIECRIYAEDPNAGFLPQAGVIRLYREPTGPGVRVDAGVAEDSLVPVHYDPLLAKLVTLGDTRETARRRAVEALTRYAILGIRTNVPYLLAILRHPRFIAGELDTRFLATEHERLKWRADEAATHAAIAAAAVHRLVAGHAPDQPPPSASVDPWRLLRGWRGWRG